MNIDWLLNPFFLNIMSVTNFLRENMEILNFMYHVIYVKLISNFIVNFFKLEKAIDPITPFCIPTRDCKQL